MRHVGCKSHHWQIYVRLSFWSNTQPADDEIMSGVFDDLFIEYLFDLVEQTRDNPDDTFNYAIIKLIVSRAEESSPNAHADKI